MADKLAVLAFKALGKLSLTLVRQLGRFFCALFAALPTETRRVTEININLCFANESDAFRRALVTKSLVETVIMAFEMGPAGQATAST